MKCQDLALDTQALLFVEDNLRKGLTLSRQVLTCLDISGGSVVAYLPPDIDTSTIKTRLSDEFRFGYITKLGGTLNCIVEFVKSYLSAESRRIVIFENANASANDPRLDEDGNVLIFGDEVYYMLSSKDSDEDVRNSIVSANSLWIHIGILTSVPDISDWDPKSTLGSADISDLAKRVEHIIVGAFDGEGFLIWSRSDEASG